MIASCDCYVSLHRSEGLGLTMGEAMYFGKPVIATAYSGNLDFMTEANSYLVPHAMSRDRPRCVALPARQGVGGAGPGPRRAADAKVFEDPEAAALRGERAAEDIRQTHSPQAACEAI